MIEQKLRDLMAVGLANILRRFAFDPKYFDLWQSQGYHIKPTSFYSPLPDTRELLNNIWDDISPNLGGIEWNEVQQLQFLKIFPEKYFHEYNVFTERKPNNNSQFYLGNVSFETVDAEILYCMVRYFRPHQIIEIGSGYSSLLAAEALAKNISEGYQGCFTAIEPYPPEFLRHKLPITIQLLEQPVQKVPLERFTSLKSGDILFIDSSHVCKVGSDVHYEFLKILPCLAPGVIIHVHDIFLPAEYPKQWVKDWHRFWNEQYILQAFLSFNSAFEVLWAGSYMHLYHKDKLSNAFNSYDPNQNWPASFWLRRVDASSHS